MWCPNFDAVGINQNLITKYFGGTSSLIGGIGLKQLQEETLNRFEKVKTIISETKLDDGGEYAFRINGEKHAWSPSTISNLQQAVRVNSRESFESFSKEINDHSKSMLTIRSLLDFNKKEKVDINKVESCEEIVKRFSTGAMSFGSISREAHTTLALAMNRIGGKSNTGEGGEEAERFKKLKNGDSNEERY